MPILKKWKTSTERNFSKNNVSKWLATSIGEYQIVKTKRSAKLLFILCGIGVAVTPVVVNASQSANQAIVSLETGHTVTKVRSAKSGSEQVIFASTYEGAVMALTLDGESLWTNPLSGYMNHDIWAGDLDNDGKDEYFAANADGNVYCLAHDGSLQWSFKANDVPMNAVTTLKNNDQTVVVAGGYDNSFYYLDTKGKVIKEVKSEDYSISKPRFKRTSSFDEEGARTPHVSRHSVNFLRAVTDRKGQQSLVVLTAINSMQGSGAIFVFEPLSDKPKYASAVNVTRAPIGELRVADIDGDGDEEVLMGSTKIKQNSLTIFDPFEEKLSAFPLASITKNFKEFGYRIAQPEVVNFKGKKSYLVIYGNRLAIFPVGKKVKDVSTVTSQYSFNDIWLLDDSKIMLASAQSGGSNIHIMDINHADWEAAYSNFTPPGKISELNANVELLKQQVASFKPTFNNKPVYLMSDSTKADRKIMEKIRKEYTSPIFLGYGSLGSEDYDRRIIKNEFYRTKKDGRQKYNLSQQQILKKAQKLYKDGYGASYWGGHGNDPHFRSLDTHKKTLDVANGAKTVMIFPEIAHYNRDFEEMLVDFFFPLAEVSQQKNAIIFLRNKHTFWQSLIYREGWARLMSGEFADVFVPAMEETTDKSMELSLASRMGLWAGGTMNAWGTRFSRDNTSFDRLRQHSHQMLANHALRQFVYHISSGSTYINNFAFNSEYMEVLWEMIGKGVIFVPESKDILSFSPVHLSMLPPDGHYSDEGNNVKWLNNFDSKIEKDNKLVFGHLNGSWPGSPNTEWDFSRYAAGVQDRRLNFLPPYKNGLVLITPPQEGKFADQDAPRGKLVDRLHPHYKGQLEEFYTDGRHYYSQDGKSKFNADEYYKVVEQSIQAKSKHLPVRVSGDVAWVVTQVSPKKLRLTVVDGGYINPAKRDVEVILNDQLKVDSLVDVLTGQQIKVESAKAKVVVPTGLFRFIDINLKQAL